MVNSLKKSAIKTRIVFRPAYCAYLPKFHVFSEVSRKGKRRQILRLAFEVPLARVLRAFVKGVGGCVLPTAAASSHFLLLRLKSHISRLTSFPALRKSHYALLTLTLLTTLYALPTSAQYFNSTGGKIHIGGGAMNVQGKMLLDTASVLENKATLKTDSLKNAGNIKLTGTNAQLVIDSGVILEKGKLELNWNKLVLLNSDTASLQVTEGKLIAEDSLWGKVVWHIGEATGKYNVPFMNDSLQDVAMEMNIIEAGDSAGIFEFSTYKTATDNSPKPFELEINRFASAGVDSHALKIADRYWYIDTKGYAENPVSEITLNYDSSELNSTDDSLIVSRLGNKCWKDWTQLSGTLNTAQRKFQTDSLSKYNLMVLHKPVNWSVAGTASHYAKPVSPAPQLVSSDTAYTFTFPNITAKYWGNQIEWAFDSSFSGSQIEASPHNITVTVAPMADTLLWLRSRDSITGCYTEAVTTIAIVDTMHPQEPPTDTFDAVCAGFSKMIDIDSSEIGLEYFLRILTTAIDSAMGNDSILNLNTGIVDTTTIFNILAVDTATGDTILIDTSYVMQVIDSVETPVFIEGDTFVHVDDSICFFAAAENSTNLVYKIYSGSADIDSLTGCISNVASDFTIRAIAKGLPSCGTKTKNLLVTITEITAPVPPEAQYAVVDTQQTMEFVFDSIVAGTGGNQIEWAFNPDFEDSEIFASPATISFYLDAGRDTLIYLRSRHNETGEVSRTVSTGARLAYSLLSAGLLDKSQWVVIDTMSDEFNYDPAIRIDQLIDFQDKWVMNYCGWNGDGPCSNDASCDHTHGTGELQYYNSGNDDNGSGGEIFFSNGVATFTATRQSPKYNSPNCGQWDFISGMLNSQNTYDLSTPGLFEIRCQTPAGIGAWPAFWLWGAWGDAPRNTFTSGDAEIDILENAIDFSGHEKRTTSNIHDWDPHVGCGKAFFKMTPCDFSEDWHTYSVMVSASEIIFFVDGKETWSSFRDENNSPYPTSLKAARLIINLAITATYGLDSPVDEHIFKVDYVRYYQPAASNTSIPPQVLQNIQNGVSKTLESPNAVTVPHEIVSNVAAYTKISTANTGSNIKVFYQAPNKNCAYYSYLVSGTWRQQRIWNSSIANVNNFLTPVNENLIYYQGTSDDLWFFKKGTNGWGTHRTYINHNSLTPVNNCIGYLSIAAPAKNVYFLGSDGGSNYNIWYWNPGSGRLFQMTNSNVVSSEIAIHASGLLAFYRDDSYNIRQVYRSWTTGTWEELIVVPNVAANSLVIDDANSRIYFINLFNHSVYSYTWDYTAVRPGGLQKLGNQGVLDNQNNSSLCNSYYNAATNLVLSNDKSTLYFKATDGQLWYYFNDKEFSVATINNQIFEVSRENWNRTPLQYRKLIAGPIAVESSNTGKLFYVNANNQLSAVNWVNADNMRNCSINGNPDESYALFKADSTKNNNKSEFSIENNNPKEIHALVYPNPSDNSFTFIISNLDECGGLEIQIGDLTGKTLYKLKTLIEKDSYQFSWNSNQAYSGIYIYKIKAGDCNFITGKLLKL